MNVSTIVLTAVLALLSIQSVWTQESVRVADGGTLSPGQRTRIEVTGTLQQAGDVEISLAYPIQLLRIRSVQGGAAFAMSCPSPSTQRTGAAGGMDTVRFRCRSTNSGVDVVIAALEVEALIDAKGTAEIVPVGLQRDGVRQEAVAYTRGTVTIVGGDDVGFVLREGFTGNYPNPMSAQSDFIFTVLEAETVQLMIRNLQGRLVRDIGSIEATAGENRYALTVGRNELSQGAYVMQLITSRGSYLHPFMILD